MSGNNDRIPDTTDHLALTEVEKAMLWERMSGERLSDAERAKILAGGKFLPPGLSPMGNESQTTIHFQIKRESIIAPTRQIIGWRWDATRGVVREPMPDYLAITREIVEGTVTNAS